MLLALTNQWITLGVHCHIIVFEYSAYISILRHVRYVSLITSMRHVCLLGIEVWHSFSTYSPRKHILMCINECIDAFLTETIDQTLDLV